MSSDSNIIPFPSRAAPAVALFNRCHFAQGIVIRERSADGAVELVVFAPADDYTGPRGYIDIFPDRIEIVDVALLPGSRTDQAAAK